jgi:hypothetical protein
MRSKEAEEEGLERRTRSKIPYLYCLADLEQALDRCDAAILILLMAEKYIKLSEVMPDLI